MDIISVSTENAPAAIGPYSQATVCGDTVYTSGQIALDPATGELVGLGIAMQTEQIIKNLSAVLAAAGSSLDRVVKTTCYLADMDDFAEFNEVYARYFTGKPARSCVAVKRLPRGALAEIEAISLRHTDMIKPAVAKPESGKSYDGVVTRIIPIGAFVEFAPGMEGLVHISKLAAVRPDRVEDVVSVGDKVRVKLLRVDEKGRYDLSIKDAD